MTPLRLVGIGVLVFVMSLSAICKRLPHSLTSTDNGSQVQDEDRDDPAVDMLCLQGFTYLGNEEYDKAIDAYTQAIGRDPKYPFAYLARGNAYRAKGDLERALADYDKARRLDPHNDLAGMLANSVRDEQQGQREKSKTIVIGEGASDADLPSERDAADR